MDEKCIVCGTVFIPNERGECSYCAAEKSAAKELMKEQPFTLTRDNYYTREADWAYMSCSQYQGFLECEAKQMAKLQGRFVEEPSEALIVGNYVHTYMEGDEPHNEFVNEHFNDIFKTKEDKKTSLTVVTGKYAAYVTADAIIDCINRDTTLTQFREMPGNIEEIMTGEIFGVPWRIRMDKRIPDSRIIIDWKTSANIRELKYNPETKERETFIEAYGYMMRAAVYSEIEKQNTGEKTDPVFLIAAISKQDPPDKGLFMLNHRDKYMYELEKIKEKLSRIIQVKSGQALPRRCGHCEYCRKTAGPLQIKPYYVLKPECWEGYEVDSAAREAVADPPQEARMEPVPAMPSAD